MKCKILWLVILFSILLMNRIYAHDVFEKLKAAYAQGKLTYEQYLVYSALNIFEPTRVPQNYQRLSTDTPMKSGTFLIHEIKRSWNQLSLQSRVLLSPYFVRPSLPYNISSPSTRFRVHYDTEGVNRVNSTDVDNNGIPDFVEWTAYYFDHTHHTIIDSLGYQSPAPDSGGMGKEFDIYLVALNQTYGITWLEETVPRRSYAWSCYIEIDNDYTGFKPKPIEALMVTTAHEYFHAVQASYRYRDEDVFFMEMCSTWMEDFIYDQVNDYLQQYLPNFFNDINYPFYYTNGNWFEYASCLWIHMIAKKYHPDLIRKVWEKIPQQTAFSAIQQTLLEIGTTFNQELASFGLWNYFTGSRADTLQYYSEGNLYPEVRFKADCNLDENQIFFQDEMRKLSSIYYHVLDPIHGDDMALIVTNLAIPSNNLTADQDSLMINIVSASDIQLRDSTFFRRNNLIKLTDYVGAQLSVAEGQNWFAQAVITDEDKTTKVIQFFPPFFITEPTSTNFINSIYPNPFIIGQNDLLMITCVVSDKKAGELAIYTSEGRLISREEFPASSQNYYIFGWDGKTTTGELVSNGVYIALLRAGGSVNMKKIAVIRK